MSPFHVICVTCSARLTVRNEALVGKILACPKCGSMVLVEPPARAAAASSAVAANLASPKVAEPPPAAPTFDEVADLHDDPATSEVASASSAEASSVAQSTASRFPERGSATAIIGGALAGAVVVAVAMTMWSSPPAPTTSANAAPTSTNAPPGSDTETSPAPVVDAIDLTQDDDAVRAAAPTSPPDSIAPSVERTPELPTIAAEAPLDEAPTDPRVADPAEPPADPFADLPAPAADSVAHEAVGADAPRMVIESPRGSREIDPLDLDPEGLDLASLFVPARPATPATEVAEPAPIAEPAPSDPSVDAPDAHTAVRRESVGAPVRRPDAATALELRFPSIAARKMPLCRFVDLATQLSGAPVSVTPQQLRLAGIVASRGVDVDMQDATFEQVLVAAAKPLRLAPRIVGDQIVLERTDLPARRTIEYAVGDLATGESDADAIARWVRELVEPECWDAVGGDATLAVGGDKLSINAPEPVQYDVLLLLERIRVARGLPAKSRYPAKLVAGESPYRILAPRMTALATFTFTDFTPLREVFRHWQEELEVAVLVDWPALAGLDLTPQTRIACSRHGVPWDEALDAVLAPLGLGWAAVDGRTIEITSLATLADRRETHLYRGVSPAAGAIPVGDEVYALNASPSEHRRLAPQPAR
ncbi:MAG: hypothetical protein KF688_01620 [Pirellulales bacterium]|nr:hypothetical protein [Pirellulales bacterium]